MGIPVPDILGVTASSFTNNKELLISLERWQAILQCNQEFLQNGAIDPCSHPYMNREVVESWVRSRNFGVNPYEVVTSPNLTLETLSQILEKNRQLIDTTYSVTKFFKDLILNCGYMLYLFDKTGVILLHEGDWGNIPLFHKHNSRKGILAAEYSEGTTAHELCIRLRRPIQLLGPEHYCVAFQKSIASAAPIQDESGEIIAALVLLSHPSLNPPSEDILKNVCLHSFGLIISMAMTIEAQYKLINTNHTLCTIRTKTQTSSEHLKIAKDMLTCVQNTLNATLTLVNECLMAIDSFGKIIHINPDAMRILNIRPDEIINRNIREFLHNETTILTLAEKGENVTVEEGILVGSDRQSFQISIRSVLNPLTNKFDIAVLKLIPSEKPADQPISRSGAGTASSASYTFSDIIGESTVFIKTIALAQRFANSPENILLIGESGTGKELFAHAIHNMYRPQGPFMAVNCAAMPRELIESELFGYVGGSFTGAERGGRPGKIELAHGGTLFLDEIGDMPFDLQAVLLRTLEDKQVMRVGGNRYKKVDFRLIAVTNKDLYELVKEYKFREDLYFRLSVLTLTIPPLRERSTDIEILSNFLINKYCQKQKWTIPKVAPDTQRIINDYPWPGNVRQLQNAIIYALNTVQGDLIKPENLPNYITHGCSHNSNCTTSEVLYLEALEKTAIEAALRQTDNCVPSAAALLGISRSTIYRKLKVYNISPLKIEDKPTDNERLSEILCLESIEKAAIETALQNSANCVPVAAALLGISRSTLYRKLKDHKLV